jgi:hypothetical protein
MLCPSEHSVTNNRFQLQSKFVAVICRVGQLAAILGTPRYSIDVVSVFFVV